MEKDKKPFISIIIPVKNGEKFIKRCLESILLCDYPRECYEIIVVDNVSSDNTIVVAQEKGALVFISSKSTISGLRNIGVSKAKGDIVAFVDSDCVVHLSWLKTAAGILDNDKIIACGSFPIVEDKASWVQKTWEFNYTTVEKEKKVDYLATMNLFVKKEYFLKVNGFDELLFTNEDADLCYRLKQYGNIVSNKDIKVTHLGEPKTLKDFFLRELWLGQNNYSSILRRRIVLSEMPSLIMPLYVLSMIGISLYSIVNNRPLISIIGLILFIFPAILLALQRSLRKRNFEYYLKLVSLYLIYFIARTLAIFIKANHRVRNNNLQDD